MKPDLPRHTFPSRFWFGDLVRIDGDASIQAVVTGFCFRERGYDVEVCWFHAGAHYCVWISESRLAIVAHNPRGTP